MNSPADRREIQIADSGRVGSGCPYSSNGGAYGAGSMAAVTLKTSVSVSTPYSTRRGKRPGGSRPLGKTSISSRTGTYQIVHSPAASWWIASAPGSGRERFT